MAQKAQQGYLSVATAAGATKTITGITNANPGVVTSSAHGLANGSVGILSGLVGITQLNNRAAVVANQATNTFELKGLDTSTANGYGTYTSGGIWTPQTMVEVGEVRSINGFDGQAADIDVTHLRSVGKEYLTGLADFGDVNLTLWLPNSNDAGQKRLRDLREIQATAAFTVTLASGQVCAFVGLVKSFALSGLEVDNAVQAACAIKVSNAPAWFA